MTKEIKLPKETPFVAGAVIGVGLGYLVGRYVIAKQSQKPQWIQDHMALKGQKFEGDKK